MRLSRLVISSFCALLLTAPARAVPLIQVDEDDRGAPPAVGSFAASCFCGADATLSSAPDWQIFPRAPGATHAAGFFDTDAGRLSGAAAAAGGAGSDQGLPTFRGFLPNGWPIGDGTGPAAIDLATGRSFAVDLADILSFGRKNIPAVGAMVRAVTVIDAAEPVTVVAGAVPDPTVSEPTMLAALGIGLVALGLRRKRRISA